MAAVASSGWPARGRLARPPRSSWRAAAPTATSAGPTPRGARHLSAWDQSAHGRNAVGCETCHGGKPHTFELFEAHTGDPALHQPRQPRGPINLAATCGRCHLGPLCGVPEEPPLRAAPQRRSRSPDLRHLPRRGRGLPPVAPPARRPVLRAATARASVAPNTDLAAGRPPPAGRHSRRASAAEGSPAPSSAHRRQAASSAAGGRRRTRAETPLRQATDAGHAFVFDGLKERLAEAERRIARLNEGWPIPTPADRPREAARKACARPGIDARPSRDQPRVRSRSLAGHGIAWHPACCLASHRAGDGQPRSASPDTGTSPHRGSACQDRRRRWDVDDPVRCLPSVLAWGLGSAALFAARDAAPGEKLSLRLREDLRRVPPGDPRLLVRVGARAFGHRARSSSRRCAPPWTRPRTRAPSVTSASVPRARPPF